MSVRVGKFVCRGHSTKVKVTGGKNVVKVVGATSIEGFLVV